MRKTLLFLVLLIGLMAPRPTALQAEGVSHFLERKVAAVGKAAPDFELSDTAGGKHALSASKGKPVMIHFWSATCPFVVRYDERLKQIAGDYTDRVTVLAIDSNTNETRDQIQATASERGITYPILLDPTSDVADLFGAVTTPHVFILDAEGALVYEGAVDDQGWSEGNPVTKSYAREVLDALLAGNPSPYSETKTVGCTVKRG